MTDIIDIHPHVISPDTAAYPLKPLGGNQSKWSEAHPTSHEDLIAAMDGAGVSKAVVVQASTAYGHDNSYLADSVAAHPDRFTGVFSVDVMAEDAVEKIQYWQGKGLSGLRLFTTGSTMPGQAGWLGDPASFPAWAHAEKTGLPVCVQMRPEGIPALTGLLERFPGAIVILDHLARPVLEDGAPYAAAQGLWDLAAHPGVHLKLTLRNIEAAQTGASRLEDFLAHILDLFGASRIAWGSNFPAAERTLAYIVERAQEALAPLPEADRRMIFSGTARKLYPVLAEMPGVEA
ncbi:amidohydrolase family protein (plasmid) [Salipiger sp. H15]|uniref:Amidohydrolase family protein n=1 Tax=Alloyangia sp. H15 TaxID=3029062 RepID=A0AAU8AS74_9RHOB